MNVLHSVGVVARALPIGDGLTVKLRRDDGGTVSLECQDAGDETAAAIRAARLGGHRVSIRHTAAGRVVACADPEGAIAA